VRASCSFEGPNPPDYNILSEGEFATAVVWCGEGRCRVFKLSLRQDWALVAGIFTSDEAMQRLMRVSGMSASGKPSLPAVDVCLTVAMAKDLSLPGIVPLHSLLWKAGGLI
jgi:hypothetical protein